MYKGETMHAQGQKWRDAALHSLGPPLIVSGVMRGLNNKIVRHDLRYKPLSPPKALFLADSVRRCLLPCARFRPQEAVAIYLP